MTERLWHLAVHKFMGGAKRKQSERGHRYEDDRLYCMACKDQPDYFEEITNWQRSHVTPRGKLIDVKDGDVGYQCPTCGGTAEWESEGD